MWYQWSVNSKATRQNTEHIAVDNGLGYAKGKRGNGCGCVVAHPFISFILSNVSGKIPFRLVTMY